MTAANAAPESMPNTPTATAMANSKLLLAAVKICKFVHINKQKKLTDRDRLAGFPRRRAVEASQIIFNEWALVPQRTQANKGFFQNGG